MSNPLSHLLAATCVVLFGGCASSVKDLKEAPSNSSRLGAAEFQQVMGHVLGAAFSEGNSIKTLKDGDEIFPAMLHDIRSAQHTINFETYVFEKGDIPQRFADALAERARAGVKVSVIIDAHGGKKSRPYHQALRNAGVNLVLYHPVWKSLVRYNNRTHRKLLIIDGRIAFMGGVGIADEWKGHAESPEHWHDTHYRLEGPVVAQAQAAFLDNWLKENGSLLHGLDYFPPLRSPGTMRASLFYSSPEHGSRGTEIMVNLALSSARKSVVIENAYFVPDPEAVDSLVRAARRGVRIQIIVPGAHIDQKAVRRASQASWGPLLDAGVEIYEYQPTMAHSKFMVVDGLFVSVGSSNLDYRSLRTNGEANVNVIDARFAAEHTRIFAEDLTKSRRITREEQRKRALKAFLLHTLERPMKGLL